MSRYKDYIRKGRLKNGFYELDKITDKWGYIRQGYMERMPLIMAASETNIKTCVSSNFIDWSIVFSPIEYDAWISIKNYGLPLYPQFPLFNYFIDFANPCLRIGLELDGEQFHDPEKDKLRDQILADFGWKIFRVKGKECYKEFKTLSDLNDEDESSKYREIQNWLCNTCDGVIKSIETIYFNDRDDTPNEYYRLALRSLNDHKLAKFELLD